LKFSYPNWSKKGDALSPLLYNFALEYAIEKVQKNQVGLKLNMPLQLPAHADDVNLLGCNTDTINRSTVSLTDAGVRKFV
jgi:hypothetical protein